MADAKAARVIVAAGLIPFAGNADAVSVFARIACRKIYGGCHATILSGNALTVANGMDLAINKLTHPYHLGYKFNLLLKKKGL